MTADVIPFRRPLVPVRVELSSPGTSRGRPFYIVDYAEADGEGSTVWGGHDLAEARKVAREIGAEDGLPVLDLTGASAAEIQARSVR